MDVSNVASVLAGTRQAVSAQPERAAPSAPNMPSGQSAAPPPSAAEVQGAVEAINAQIQQAAKGLRFSVDETTGKTVVRVVDVETEQVIRQIPSEEVLAISRSIERLQGLLLDQQI